MPTELLHEEMTGRIRQVAFEVHRYFGSGLLEKVYENSMANRLRKAGFTVKQQAPVIVKDEDGSIVGEYFVDLLLNDCLIIEVKAAKAISLEHVAQIFHYLRATGYRLGLLINFGAKIMEFKRVVCTL
jgi:GxxExxY protein